jgi:hypothetical protein
VRAGSSASFDGVHTKPFRASEAGFRENLLRADCDDYLPVRFRNPENLVFLAGAASTDMSIGGQKQKRPCP